MSSASLRLLFAFFLLSLCGLSQAYSLADCGVSYECVPPQRTASGPMPQDVVGSAYPDLPPYTSSCAIMGAGNSGHVETRNASGKVIGWINAMQIEEGAPVPPGWSSITLCLPPPGNKYYLLVMAFGGAEYRCPASHVLVSDEQTMMCLSPLNPKNKGCNCPEDRKPMAGNPINVAMGNKFQVETDYTGMGSYPLEFKRYYNSMGSVDSGMGIVWSHSYGASLSVSSLSGQSRVAASRPEGAVYFFKVSDLPNPETPEVGFRLTQLSTGPYAWDMYDMQRDRHEFYDAQGRLRKLTERSGFSRTLSYVDDGPSSFRLTKVEDDFGRKILINMDGGLVKSITLPDGNTINYQFYNSWDGNLLIKTIYQDGRMHGYGYDYLGSSIYGTNNNVLTRIVDEKDIEYARWDYDRAYGVFGRAIYSTHPGGVEATTIDYLSGNGTTYVTDALGNRKTISYTSVYGEYRGTASTAPCKTNCSMATQSVTYDSNGNIASSTDFNGRVTTYAYDMARNLETSRTEAYGTPKARTTSTTWHTGFRLPLSVTEPGRVTSYTYDSNGNRLTKTVTDSVSSQTQIWTWTYNSMGQVLTEDGPRTDVSDTTTYSYYDNTSPYFGYLATVTNAAGQITQFTTYDTGGRLLTQTDPNGVVTTYTYDARGRQLTRTVNSKTTTYEYDAIGQMTKVTLPDGNWVAYVYDDARRLTKIQDKAGNSIAYTLDLMSRRIKEEVIDAQGGLASQLQWINSSLSSNSPAAGPQG